MQRDFFDLHRSKSKPSKMLYGLRFWPSQMTYQCLKLRDLAVIQTNDTDKKYHRYHLKRKGKTLHIIQPGDIIAVDSDHNVLAFTKEEWVKNYEPYR